MLSPVSPTQKPTCPCDASDPRENTATAPSCPPSTGRPQARYDLAIRERVLAMLALSRQAPANASHHAASNAARAGSSGDSAEKICAIVPFGHTSCSFEASATAAARHPREPTTVPTRPRSSRAARPRRSRPTSAMRPAGRLAQRRNAERLSPAPTRRPRASSPAPRPPRISHTRQGVAANRCPRRQLIVARPKLPIV